MKRLYAFDLAKQVDVKKIIEADPYSDDSIARIGYTLKDGSSIDEDKSMLFLYLSGDEAKLKKADEKLKGLVLKLKPEDEKRIMDKIIKEQEQAENAFGDLFG